MVWIKKHWISLFVIVGQLVLNCYWATRSLGSYQLAHPGWMTVYLLMFGIGLFVIFTNTRDILRKQ